MSSIFESVSELRGQKVAALCGRYQYRGVLSDVTDDGISLSNAACVEISGRSNADAPETEDNIGSTVFIMKRAIEIVYQPQWVNADLPGEK